MMQRILTLLTFGIAVRLHAAQRCDLNELNGCMAELKKLAGNQDLVFVNSEFELNTVCRGLNRAMNCINDFTDRCLDPSQRSQYMKLTSGPRKLINEMCTENSDFRKKYFKHAPCLNKISSEYKKCSDKYIEAQEKLTMRNDLSPQEQLRQSCCIFDHHLHCSTNLALDHCGSDAADLVRESISTGGGSLVQEHCSEYTYDSEYCASGASRISRTTLCLLIVGVLFALFGKISVFES